MNKQKRILIVGGLGVVGRILSRGLGTSYDTIVADRATDIRQSGPTSIPLDVTDYERMIASMPDELDAIVNLTALPETSNLVNAREFQRMSDVYVLGSHNVYLAAVERGIPRVIFASTNHVTGSYEHQGQSTLGREIGVTDYPNPNSVYGALKLCGEALGHVFAMRTPLSVICLRIGTVREDERSAVISDVRVRRTLLSTTDTIDIFSKSLEAEVKFGIYNAVSDNPGRPWSIETAISELGFDPKVNAEQVLADS